MKSPTHPRDGAGELPEEARSALRKAARPTAPTAAERALMTSMAARIAALPAPPGGGGAGGAGAGGGAWSKLAALGGWRGLGVAGVVLAVGGAAWLGARPSDEGARPAPVTTLATGASKGAGDPVVDEGVPGNGAAAGRGDPAKGDLPVDNHGSGDGRTAAGRDALTGVESGPAATAPGGGREADVALNTTPRARPSSGAPARSPAARASARPGAPAAAAVSSTCPSGTAGAGDRSAEAAILSAAARALGQSPAVTLACIQQLSAIGGPWQLGDEHHFLGFEASRRLGRDADARRFGLALLRGSPSSAYAARVRAHLGDELVVP